MDPTTEAGSVSLWEVIKSGLGIIGGLASVGFVHFHNRMAQLEVNVEKKLDEMRKGQSAAQTAGDDKIWEELRRNAEADREFREKVLLNMVTKDDLFKAVQGLKESRGASGAHND